MSAIALGTAALVSPYIQDVHLAHFLMFCRIYLRVGVVSMQTMSSRITGLTSLLREVWQCESNNQVGHNVLSLSLNICVFACPCQQLTLVTSIHMFSANTIESLSYS